MSPLYAAYGSLAIAIIAELAGTSFLQKSEGFTKPVPTLIMIGCYCVAFFFLSRVLLVIPMGVAYAIWAGLGIVLVALMGYVLFRHTLDLPAIIGITMIVGGVLVLNLFSKSTTH